MKILHKPLKPYSSLSVSRSVPGSVSMFRSKSGSMFGSGSMSRSWSVPMFWAGSLSSRLK